MVLGIQEETITIFRHGDRAPFFDYKTNPHKDAFPEGPFQLTKIGKQHMYKKGQILRKLYDGFLCKLYLDSEIYTKTTTVARTHMTAAMVLAGLYPPTSYLKWSENETVWTPIPVYGGSPDRGDGKMDDCPAFDSVQKEAREGAQSCTDDAIDKMLPYFSEKCNQTIDYNNLYLLYDLLKCQTAAKLELPEWMTWGQFKKIEEFYERKDVIQYTFGNKRLQNMYAGPLLKEIAKKIQEKSNANDNSTENRKMLLYSGHDYSLGFSASVLDNMMPIKSFGGSLHFHLHYSKGSVGDVVKVFYFENWNEDQGIQLPLKICGNPCTVANFVKLIDSKLPKTWEEDCNDVK
ncbi:lysosomal acid phosphatase-like isoform X2 [Daktulosphaira vitifoliae]|uniref:lysosomal acid phosphatase-like isoform X2 n=1 Tax=Daktulosphaira vitifoliae TaxID=58002 RepID=UPI0021AAA9EB|nr:lysosomal acid phosphatase-like isoform X2 [Daktulosphaira vitifoliae]